MKKVIAVFAAALCACAAAPVVPEAQLTPTGKMPWPAQTQDPPDAPAKVAYSALECEREARAAFEGGDTEWGWRALVACTERADFMDLRPLLRRPWKDEIGRRGSEGAEMLGRVLVRTDLELGYDLRRIQNAGIPLLDMKQVADDPALAAGQFVILRATVGSRKASPSGELVQLFEQKQVGFYEGMGGGEEGQGGGGAFSPAQVARMGGPGALAYAGTGYFGIPTVGTPLGRGMRGGMIGPGRPYSGWPYGAPYNNDYRAIGPVYGEQSEDTGREAVLDLDHLDPRLTHGLEIAVLAQVVGAGQSDDWSDVCRSGDVSGSITCRKERLQGPPTATLKPVRIWILEASDSDEP
ncbi:MAG TPA: hypothetical protein VMB50_10440 [Myxococcales bacterium]|nr:hypothetical protein [Myxococcales bacterium]